MEVMYSQPRMQVKPGIGPRTTFFLLRKGEPFVLRGSLDDVVDALRALCPSGKIKDLTRRNDQCRR